MLSDYMFPGDSDPLNWSTGGEAIPEYPDGWFEATPGFAPAASAGERGEPSGYIYDCMRPTDQWVVTSAPKRWVNRLAILHATSALHVVGAVWLHCNK